MKEQTTFDRYARRALTPVLTPALLLVLGVFAASCGGGGGGLFGGVARVVGQAVRPATGLIESNPLPLGDAVITVRDFADSRTSVARTFEAGRTDANGNYAVDIEGQTVAAVIIVGVTSQGTIRISGLINPNDVNVGKNLDGFTDAACEAGLSAVDDGSISNEELNSERIANLEAGARKILSTTRVNFFNAAEVSAAARAIRALTDNGRQPPADDVPTEGACAAAEFQCANGACIAASSVCNTANDCSDGSDESPSLCGNQSSCCNSTAGCPGETADQCSQSCCCCPFGERCDQNDFNRGCVAARTLRGGSEDSPLSKWLNQGTYF